MNWIWSFDPRGIFFWLARDDIRKLWTMYSVLGRYLAWAMLLTAPRPPLTSTTVFLTKKYKNSHQ